jgi:hypothetical protein
MKTNKNKVKCPKSKAKNRYWHQKKGRFFRFTINNLQEPVQPLEKGAVLQAPLCDA